jgi:hypothetical protein
VNKKALFLCLLLVWFCGCEQKKENLAGYSVTSANFSLSENEAHEVAKFLVKEKIKNSDGKELSVVFTSIEYLEFYGKGSGRLYEAPVMLAEARIDGVPFFGYTIFLNQERKCVLIDSVKNLLSNRQILTDKEAGIMELEPTMPEKKIIPKNENKSSA